MGARGAGLPAAAKVLVVSAALVAAGAASPALLRPAGTDWAVVLPLTALYALAEYAPRCPLFRARTPRTQSRLAASRGDHGAPPEVCGPLLLTAVLLLPPEAAALVPLAGAAVARVPARHAAARRVWRAARLSLAAYVAALTPHLLPGLPAGEPVAAAGLPGALLPVALAVPAYCLVLAALDGAILVLAERCAPRAAWRGRFAPALPPHLVHALAGLLMAVLWRSPYGPVAALFVLLPMALCCWVFGEYERERTAHRATVRALVQAVDIKDRYTRGHSERVGRASALIARELDMDDDRTETLRFAGILHDVGKLGVPTRLLRKAGPLSPLERSVLELHPEYGHEMVRGIRFLGEARSAILHHHERLDGTGYPYGLSGDQIPEPARVVAVADAFDAMTSNRSYRRARPVEDAVTELQRCSGTHFDPRMVGAFTRALGKYGWSPAVTADPSGDAAEAAAADEPPPAVSAAPRTRRAVPAARSGTRRTEGGGRHRAGAARPGIRAGPPAPDVPARPGERSHASDAGAADAPGGRGAEAAGAAAGSGAGPGAEDRAGSEPEPPHWTPGTPDDRDMAPAGQPGLLASERPEGWPPGDPDGDDPRRTPPGGRA